jgi:hypothetical protein
VSVSFALLMFGSLLIVAGWQNKSLAALARGDNTVAKGAVLAGAGSGPATSSSSGGSGASPAAQGKGGPTVGSGSTGTPAGAGGAW